MLNILIMEQKMKYSALLLFLAIFQLDGMAVKKDGKRIRDDLMELVALVGTKKVRQKNSDQPQLLSPTVHGNSEIAQVGNDYKSLGISESNGISFERIKYPYKNRCSYKCLECGSIVTNHRPHALVHLNKKPYACVCGKEYKQTGHLSGHQKRCTEALSHKKKTKASQKALELLSSESEQEFEEFPESEDEHV